MKSPQEIGENEKEMLHKVLCKMLNAPVSQDEAIACAIQDIRLFYHLKILETKQELAESLYKGFEASDEARRCRISDRKWSTYKYPLVE